MRIPAFADSMEVLAEEMKLRIHISQIGIGRWVCRVHGRTNCFFAGNYQQCNHAANERCPQIIYVHDLRGRISNMIERKVKK